jgi:hypothetical protein
MQGTEAVDDVGTPSAAEMRLQRNVKIVVLVLGVLIFAGLAAIVGRMIYLASGQKAQQAHPAALSADMPLRPELSMQLPAGAEVRSVSLSGDRLAVHYVAPGGEGITVLDLRTGEAVARVGLERLSPAK